MATLLVIMIFSSLNFFKLLNTVFCIRGGLNMGKCLILVAHNGHNSLFLVLYVCKIITDCICISIVDSYDIEFS